MSNLIQQECSIKCNNHNPTFQEMEYNFKDNNGLMISIIRATFTVNIRLLNKNIDNLIYT